MKALVLCGGMPQLYLVKLLRKRGIEAIIADINPNVPAIKYANKFYPVSTLDMNGIRNIAKQEKVDFIISVCADQMLLVAAQLSEEMGLPCYIDYETAKNVSNKEYMKRIFIENDIPTSKYIVCSEFRKEEINYMRFPLVVKPVDAYSSKGVKKVHNMCELESALKSAVEISRTKKAIIEEFVDGEEISVDFYIEEGIAKLLCARILDKIPENDGFIICRGRYPALLNDKMKLKVCNISQKIAEAFALKNTPMLIQMKINEDEISVIEFCARTGGGIKYRLLPEVSGFDVVEAVLDLTLGKKPHCDIRNKKGYIVDEFLYCNEGVLDRIEGLDDLLKNNIITDYSVFKESGYEFKKIKSSSDRVAYYSVEADTIDELIIKHKLAGKNIHAIGKKDEDLINHDIIKFERY